jgi:catechol 2,3-dioxygenase-like lactoylglutathione lyase family enzyme
MDNVGIVVDDLMATIAFFRELGLEGEQKRLTPDTRRRPGRSNVRTGAP